MIFNPIQYMSAFRKIVNQESLWGELYEPVQQKVHSGNCPKVVLFVSCNCGNVVLKNLFRFEQKYPDLINIVGVATDDPVDPAARISREKRIWSQYKPDERKVLMDKIIGSCMEIGIPCYTGSVKTDYFRNLYRRWNPEVLIMFCFGQKLDSFLFDYPARGAYNLHPSDLPKQIGAGTQPFQNAIKNGLRTSPLVIHQIEELIDMGPITGVSTPVNIRLADDSVPKSLLTLLEKITSAGGWMCVQLVSEIIKMKTRGETGPVKWIDFEKEFPEEIKQMLMRPATNDLAEMYTLQAHPLLA
jgi:methionyl-tRNA formyltransferase